ncbi:MAG TPA: CBS domain-containing protein [Acidimicrobiales bacterium]
MATTISEVMMPKPVTCRADEEIRAAAALMRERDIGDVVVVDGDEVRGIVTDRDLVVRALADGRQPETPLADVVSEGLVTVSPATSVQEAAEVMAEQAVRRLPVVDQGRLVGIVSIGDLAISQDPNSALADISAAPGNT